MIGDSSTHARRPAPGLVAPIRAVCFDWGGTLMVDDGPEGVPMSRWPEVAAVPGARKCLAALHGRVPLCVATNAAQSTRPMIEVALHRVDLRQFIDEVFCFTEIGFKKDRPEFWSAVQRRLAVPVNRIVMVGDSMEHDVVAPRSFGIQTVWFNPEGPRSGKAAESVAVVELEEVVDLIKGVL